MKFEPHPEVKNIHCSLVALFSIFWDSNKREKKEKEQQATDTKRKENYERARARNLVLLYLSLQIAYLNLQRGNTVNSIA